MILGAIDVGTNSVRLYVAEVVDDGLSQLERDLVITRLGEGVDGTGRLGEEPLRRTLEAIEHYHKIATGAQASRIRIACTSATRDAANSAEFLEAIRARTGVYPEILSGEQEARTSFRGATAGMSEGAPFLVLDIGGGSTEFVVGSSDVKAWISEDVGSVRLTERHVRHDPPKPEELEAVRIDARAAVERAKAIVGIEVHTLVGLAGTITTVAAVALGLKGYDRDAIHHARLESKRVGEIAEMLASMTSVERRALPAMPAGREDVIVAGVEILLEVMDGFGFPEVLVSEADILDGLVLEMLER